MEKQPGFLHPEEKERPFQGMWHSGSSILAPSTSLGNSDPGGKGTMKFLGMEMMLVLLLLG